MEGKVKGHMGCHKVERKFKRYGVLMDKQRFNVIKIFSNFTKKNAGKRSVQLHLKKGYAQEHRMTKRLLHETFFDFQYQNKSIGYWISCDNFDFDYGNTIASTFTRFSTPYFAPPHRIPHLPPIGGS